MKRFIESNNIIYRVGNIDEATGVIKQQGKELHAVPFGISALTIDEDTITIGAYSMCGCANLTNVVIPEGVKTIKRKAFVKENANSNSSSDQLFKLKCRDKIIKYLNQNIKKKKQ